MWETVGLACLKKTVVPNHPKAHAASYIFEAKPHLPSVARMKDLESFSRFSLEFGVN